MNIRRALNSILLLTLPFGSFAQPNLQVSYTTGTDKVGNVQVKVKSKGTVNINGSYCSQSQPYHIGGNKVGVGDGSYIFEFSPAVSSVKLNFSALSDSEGAYSEIVSIKVNGKQYRVKKAGKENSCDDLAVVSPEGYIAPCKGCPGSGWVDMVIEGPIETLEIKDSVVFGSPEGSLFSLFIEDTKSKPVELKSVRAIRVLHINGDPEHVRIIGIPTNGAELIVYDSSGNEIKKMAQSITNYTPIDVSGLPKGTYVFRIKSSEFNETRKVVINGS
ncbi:MAG: T9SS type A sorting domain-containing protein [Crocinitomicaceae bacterium]|nr:T9SS type A sorting domain-containing protein [Crocinitomicaceae bacterium]